MKILKATKAPNIITKNQQKVLDFVIIYLRKKGYAPTQSEIGVALKMKRSLVLYYLWELEKKGHVKTRGRKSRNIVVILT